MAPKRVIFKTHAAKNETNSDFIPYMLICLKVGERLK